MLRPVWPSLYFWYFLGLFSSFVWFSIVASMIFRSRKDENLGDVAYPSAIYLPWYFGNFALWSFFQWLLSNPNKDHLFPGYERIGKIIGVALLFIGNILVYYLTEKSVALMLVFLFVAVSFLSTLYYLQPYTDFGVLDFLVTASLNQALTLFGLRTIYTWLVLFACFVMAALRYLLEPIETPGGGEASRQVTQV